MSSTHVFTREEFSLATIRGADVGTCPVAVEVEYDHRGDWRVVATGFLTNWNPVRKDFDIEWLSDCDLDRAIMARAETHYRDAIDAEIDAVLQDDREVA